MTQFWEYIKMALMNIRCNKGRSILTMLGIIIGISSVIMVISIGNGVSGQITNELNNLAGGQLYFYSDPDQNSGDEQIQFTNADFDEIKEKIPHVKGMCDVDTMYGTANGPKNQPEAYVYGGNESLQYMYKEPIIKGRYFTKSDVDAGNPVCILRKNAAMTLFGTTNVIGETFEVTAWGQSVDLTIIGIRDDSVSSGITGMFYNSDIVELEIPNTVIGAAFGYPVDTFTGFYVFTDGPEYASQTAASIMQFLRNKYRIPAGSESIKMQDFNDSMSEISSVLDYITIFVVFVAAISLLVGGIGVMNIMLVSVTERTREIGIRKSLGARTGSVMLQFLSESAIITMIGGIIGIIFGFLGAALVCSLMKITPTISAATVIITTLFSSGIGLFFGIYPARKAAKLSPIEALRHE